MNRFLGKKKQGKKKQAKTAPVPQPPTHHGTHSTTAPSAHDVPKPAAAVKSLDDQSYSKWVEDHNNEEDQYIEEEGEEAIVLYNYTPNPQSEIDDEIALEKDEIIMVYEQHPSGWWTGQSAKHGYGLFPGSFVKLRSATGPTPSAPPALPSTTSSGSSISSSSASTSSNTTGSSIASTSSHPPSSSTSSLTATSSAASASTGTTTTPTPSSTTASIPSSADHTSNQEHPTTAQKPERPPVIRTSSSSGSFDGSHEKEGSSISSDGSYRASRGGSLLGTGTDDEPAPAKRSPSHIIRTGSASSLPVRPLAEGDSGDSVYLKSILDKLQDRVSTLHQQVPQIESAHRSSLSELELLRAENAELKKTIEEMKIEKELASWKHDKEVSELRKELATLTESQASSASSEAGSGSGVGAAAVESLQAEIARLTTSLAQERANVAELSEQVRSAQHASSPDEEVSKLKDALARESAALTLEKASNAEQVSMLLRTQLQIREELEDVRAQLREQQTLAKMAAPPPMPAGATPEDFMAHIKSYMDQKTAQMQADLLNLKKEVAKEHQTDSSLEQELAALRRQLDNEQRERAKLRQDLIDQMTASQIHRIRHDVLQRAEVKEGKLWDPVNNVFLAADGKWLRPTGIDLTN